LSLVLSRIFAKQADDVSHYNRDGCCKLYDIAGVGVSAFHNLRGVFAMSVGDHDLQHYYEPVNAGKTAINRVVVRTPDEEARRSFILPLKNAALIKSEFTERAGQGANTYFQQELEWLTGLGLVAQDEKAIWLTPRVRFFADEVAAQFFDTEYLTYKEVANARQRATAPA
jgi:coproporphyrinogen III oxidase-like Fe-S oxidoreductase